MPITEADLKDLVPEEGWTMEDFFDRMPKVHKLVTEILETYLDMGESELQTVALWIEAVNYVENFSTFPELYINGAKQTGKTRLLNLIHAMVPSSIKAVGMSESAMFRKAGEVDAVILDEAEDLASKDKKSIKDLLNVCYKAGAEVYRTEGKDKLVVKGYPVFCGLAMANISGLDSVIEDKCITIIMERSKNPAKTRIPEMFDLDPRIQTIRKFFDPEFCVVNSEGYEWFRRAGYALLLRYNNILYININYSYSSLPFTETDVKRYEAFLKDFKPSGREAELWLPLLIQAFITKTEVETLKIAGMKSEAKEDDAATNDADSNFAVFLIEQLSAKGDNEISVRDLRAGYEAQEGKTLWLDNAWIGYFMRRSGIVAKKIHTGTGNKYKVNMAKLKDYLEQRHLYQEQKSLTLPKYTTDEEPPYEPPSEEG